MRTAYSLPRCVLIDVLLLYYSLTPHQNTRFTHIGTGMTCIERTEFLKTLSDYGTRMPPALSGFPRYRKPERACFSLSSPGLQATLLEYSRSLEYQPAPNDIPLTPRMEYVRRISLHLPRVLTDEAKAINGTNAYAVLESPRASGTEAILLSASWLSMTGEGYGTLNLRGVATILALAGYLKSE